MSGVTPLPERPPLRLVDPETGEVHEQVCPECKKLEDELEATLRKLTRAWADIRNLQRDVEHEHMVHPDRERVERLHASWQRKTGHPNSQLDMGEDSRFEAYLRGLKLAKKAAKKFKLDLDPEALCERAFDGVAYDCWKQTTRNGNVERYDDPTTIFKNAANFEKMVNRAPRQGA